MRWLIRQSPLEQEEDEGIVHATGNSGVTCVRQFGPYLPWAQDA